MMLLYAKRAIKDILSNKFLHVVTIVTIALSVLIVSAFSLFFVNANEIMNSWKKGIRIMAYLKPDVDKSRVPVLKQKILGMYGVQDVMFIDKNEALDKLKTHMERQASLFDNLRENPLPDAFEIRMIASSQNPEKVEILSAQIEALPEIDDVEYGQKWLGRFNGLFNLFRLTGIAMGILFFMAAVFFVANTIRLVLYSRRDEIEIMSLVGAEEAFIKMPFYISGLIQGAMGGILGLVVLFVVYMVVSANMDQGLASVLTELKFLSAGTVILMILCSMVIGWLGCYLSLKQFLKA